MEPGTHAAVETSDRHLVRRMCAGDRQAFALLFHRYQRTVYRFALQMTGRPDAAEDITQDVFMALARSGPRYRSEDGRLSTYLYGVARNLVRQRERRQRVRAETDLDQVTDGDRLARWTDPADRLLHAARLAALRRAILRLPPHYREIIVLCELDAVSYEEAATIVGCPIGTIRSRLSRARRLLAARCRAGEATDERDSAVKLLLASRARAMAPQS